MEFWDIAAAVLVVIVPAALVFWRIIYNLFSKNKKSSSCSGCSGESGCGSKK